VAHTCGDGIVDTPTEQCDDSNSTEGDGCSSLCETEISGYELFLNYTDTDPNSKTAITTHRNNISGVTRNESANLKKDLGAGTIGDFSYDYYFNVTGCVDGGLGDISYDAGAQGTQDTLNTLTFAHTVAAGDNRLLLVSITNEDTGTRTISSVTFNGDAMTLATGVNGANNDVYIYYLLTPDVATGNVVVTWSGEVYGIAASADSFANVAQQAPALRLLTS
jgi:cysteine-rich repeat protein